MFAIKKLSILLLVGIVGPLFSLSALGAYSAQDLELRRNVLKAIDNDAAVSAYHVEAQVEDGIVTLTGKVGDAEARRRAAQLAATVPGAHLIVNRLEVRPFVRTSDREIETAINDAFTRHPATRAYTLEPNVRNGVARLSGTVNNARDRQLAGRIARNIGGVREVTNNLRIQYENQEAFRDNELADRVERALYYDSLINAANIDVAIEDGVAHLSGYVSTPAEFYRAKNTAWIEGVRNVEMSDLEVATDALNLDYEDYLEVTDEGVLDSLDERFSADPELGAEDINILSKDRVVTLQGDVPTINARNRAAALARNTAGVRSVRNRLRVRHEGSGSADTLGEDIAQLDPIQALTENIRKALFQDPLLFDENLNFDLADNLAVLTGVVDNYEEKARAERIVGDMQGVTDIQNDIRVRDTNRPLTTNPYVDTYRSQDFDWYEFQPENRDVPADVDLENEINTSLAENPLIDQNRLDIQIDSGVATVGGSVRTLSELDTVVNTAYDAGAIRVDTSQDLRIAEGEE